MTRATLLHVLRHPTTIGPAEVRELEQLAQMFPYCQTAHLLLAKAAHDQGTMLAGQRLRRAATYAADRELLRRLIEQVPEAVEAEPEMAEEESVIPAPTPVPEPATEAAAAAEPASPFIAPPVLLAPAQPEPLPISAPQAIAPEETVVASVAEIPAIQEAVSLETTLQEINTVEAQVSPLEPATVNPEPIISLELVAPVAVSSESAAAETEVIIAPEVVVEPEVNENIGATDSAITTEPETVSEAAAPPETVETPEEIPAVAPPIRPPAEVGEARFEYGLVDTPPPARFIYELPGLIDEWAAAATTLSLGSPEPATPVLAPILVAVYSAAAFTGDDAVGYAFGDGSRLGLALEALAPQAAALVPATPLPTPGLFFEPDTLLLAHWAEHRPVAPVIPTSLELINTFLKRQPRLSRPAMLPPSAESQTDLSVRSTRPESDLASESLARILVRQGKTERAIEIYQRLMVKQPEKMAYFAAQIQQLQPPA